MTDLATAYSSFANQGIKTPLKAILNIKNIDQKELTVASCPAPSESPQNATVIAVEDNCQTQKVISPKTAYFITDILSDNQARSPSFGSNSVLNIKDAKVAVKTGTSNDLRDNWTIGFTPDYLVATWVGNNDNTPMSKIASGITGASPIWANIFKEILSKHPQPKEITPPGNLIKVAICSLTKTLPCAGCPTIYEYFEKGKEPKVHCQPQEIEKLKLTLPSPLESRPR